MDMEEARECSTACAHHRPSLDAMMPGSALAERFQCFRAAGLVLWISALTSATGFGEEELHRQFQSGIEEAASKLKRLSLRVKCTTIEGYADRGDVGKRNETFVIELSGDYVKMSGTMDGVSFDAACNPDYAFRVSYTPQRSEYTLNWITSLNDATPEDRQLIDQQLSGVYAWSLTPYRIQGKFLSEWIGDERLTIESIKRSSAGGGDLVRVAYSYSPGENPVQDGSSPFPSTGYFLCDPDREWSVVELESRITSAAGESTKYLVVEAFDEADGLPIATQLRETNQGKWTFQRKLEIEVLSRDPVNSDEFYLSHYDLPEPNFGRPGYRSWLLYLVGGGACLAVAYAIRRRRSAD